MDSGKYSLQAMVKALEEGLGAPLSKRVDSILREAFSGHAGQFRASRNPQHQVPYIVHPVGVAKLAMNYLPIVSNVADDLETAASVALAHDLLEDTRVASSRIEAEAGPKVRGYVEALTKPPAGVAGRGGEDRNQEFLRQILRAGPTAVFIKICDSMHNLGSPAFTPTELLAKAINKATTQYLPLLDQCPLGDPFRAAYAACIAEAENALVKELRFARSTPVISTLETAIRECIVASTGKVLELHDITEILKRIGGTQHVGCWRLKNAVDGAFEPVAGMGQEVRPLRWPASELTELARVLKGRPAQRFGAAFGVSKPEIVITVPFRTEADAAFVVAMGFESEMEQTWIDEETASLLVQFLAHRLILSEADRRGRLATEAANLGLQLRIEVAARVGVQPSQLRELQQWRMRCEQAVAKISHAVDLLLMNGDGSIQLTQEFKIESRVKTVDSILLKMLNTHIAWPNFKSVEDIAGVRVVCPTQAGVAQLERALLSPVNGVRLHPVIPEPRRDYIANPTSDGYRALHLLLEVDTRHGDEGNCQVPCELQLRTMFQDTWAKVSHALAYQGGADAQWHAEQLKELSSKLQTYENQASLPREQQSSSFTEH